jgi:hypothetical protein
MRCHRLPFSIAAACAAGVVTGAAAVGAGVPATATVGTVYLNAQALAQLRTTNPDRYARVQRILAAAHSLCRPHAAEGYLASFGVRDFACAPMLLLTSNPPQWRIGFRIDDTRYVASVFVTGDPPRLLPVR